MVNGISILTRRYYVAFNTLPHRGHVDQTDASEVLLNDDQTATDRARDCVGRIMSPELEPCTFNIHTQSVL